MGIRSELDHFTKLGSKNDSVRYKNGRKILLILRRDRDLETLIYTLKRLITGLGGTKLRGGCFATLMSLLRSMPEHLINFEIFDDFIKHCLSPTKGDSKKEIGDAYLGQLLAYATIINTDFLKSESIEVHQVVANKLITIAQKKSYLHYPAMMYLGKLTSKYKIEEVPNSLKNHLMQIEEHTLDKLYCLLCLSENDQSEIVRAVFNTDCNDIMDDIIIKEIAKLLLKKCSETSNNHPFFELFSKRICVDCNKVKVFNKEILSKKKLLSKKQVSLSLLIMANVLEHAKAERVMSYLKKSMIQVLNTQGRIDANAKKTINIMMLHAKTLSSNQSLKLLRRILIKADCILFDKLTGQGLVKNVIENLEYNEVRILCNELLSLLEGTLDKAKPSLTETEKNEVLLYYFKLILHKSSSSKKNWKAQQLINVSIMGLFTQGKIKINSASAGAVCNFFFNACATISKNVEDHLFILSKVLNSINKNLSVGRDLRKILSPEVHQKWTEGFIFFMNKYEISKTTETAASLKILQLLGFYILIRTLRNPSNFSDEIQVLMNIYESAITEDDKSSIGDEHWSKMFIDFMIAQLAIPLNGNRKLVVQLFKNMLKYIKLDALKTLVNALTANTLNDNTDEEKDLNSSESSDQESLDSDDEEYDSESSAMSASVEETGAESMSIEMETPASSTFVQSKTLENHSTDLDNESINIDDADEDDVGRLDQLASLLMSNLKVRKKEHRNNEKSHYRIRLIDLIEVCCKQHKHIDLDFWLYLLPILLSLFHNVCREETEIPLYNKLRLCLKKISTIPFSKYHISVPQVIRVESLINEIIIEVQRGLSAEYRNTLLKLTLPFLQLLNKSKKQQTVEEDTIIEQDRILEEDPITDLLLQHLQETFSSRSKIPISYYFMIIDIKWKGVEVLIKEASTLIFDTNQKFPKRTDGIRILKYYFAKEQNYAQVPKTIINDILHTINILDFWFFNKCDNENHDKDSCICKVQQTEKFFVELISLLDIIGKTDTKQMDTCQCLIKKCDEIAKHLRVESTSVAQASTSNSDTCFDIPAKQSRKRKSLTDVEMRPANVKQYRHST